jgi:hypothetical protein
MKTVVSCVLKGLRIRVFPDHIEMEGAAPNLTVDDAKRVAASCTRPLRTSSSIGGPSRWPHPPPRPAAAGAPRGHALPATGASSDGHRGS